MNEIARLITHPRARGLLALTILLTAFAAAILPSGLPRQVPAFLLLWIWPTLTWFRSLPGSAGERALTAAALPLLAHVLLALVIVQLPGPVPTGSLLGGATLIALAPLARAPEPVPAPRSEYRHLIASFSFLLLLALFLRLPNLGYKELQGDEGIILQRAAATLTGDDQEIFLHQKGPVELLLPLSTWQLTGAITELWARLPFTWAGWLAVAAVTALSRRWFGSGPALATGLLFALNGFGIAFSRIIQYQSLVMLWGTLALLHALRYREQGATLDLFLVALFLAGALLAHYDAILVTPAVAWLLLRRVQAEGSVRWRTWVPALLAGGALLALFYLPFVLSPTFSSTGRYLLQDRLGGEAVSWSGPAVWRMLTFYNSTYYIAGLLLLLVLGLGHLWRRREPVAPLLAFAVPLLFYVVVVADPRTHVYTLFPGAALLGGLGAAAILRRCSTRNTRAALVVVFALFLFVSAGYVILLFLDVTPERERTWTENRPALYPTTWDSPPLYGLFGFPHQAGWRAVPDIVDVFPYGSNVEEEITNYYMAQAPRTHCANFESFLLAERVQDPVPYEATAVDSLHLQQQVSVNGRIAVRVFGRDPVADVPTVEAAGRTLWRTPAEVAPPRPNGQVPLDVTLAGRVRLLGYDLDSSQAYPGGRLIVTLYWEALAPFTHNYQAFVHLNDGALRAQHDGAPECAVNPTTRWEPGQVIPDPHIVPLPPEIPVKAIPVYVGLYELISTERLRDGAHPDGLIYLTDVKIAHQN